MQTELKNSKPTIETVDLTAEDAGPSNKRARTAESAPKSNLAILHEQGKKMTGVKKEKNDTETKLNSVQHEKQALESNLEEASDNLEDAQEMRDHLALSTDIWQGRFDEFPG